ncbi:MAG: hypothetical protein WBW67_24005 [Pseudolabrys sp.]
MTTRHAERSSEPLLDNGWTRRSRSRTGIELSLLVSYAIRDGASSHSGRGRSWPSAAIAEIAGHTSIRTTAMYVESNPKRLARILQDLTFQVSQMSAFSVAIGGKADMPFCTAHVCF